MASVFSDVRRINSRLALFLWLVVVWVVAIVGSIVTLPKIDTWYAGLVKPGFTPPDAIFGPAWAILYVAMAVAAWRVTISRARVEDRSRAISLFVVQLALNALWPPVFFGWEAPRLGLLVIVALLIAIAASVAAFWRIDRPAGYLMIPYLAWVGYATALNGAIVALN